MGKGRQAHAAEQQNHSIWLTLKAAGNPKTWLARPAQILLSHIKKTVANLDHILIRHLWTSSQTCFLCCLEIYHNKLEKLKFCFVLFFLLLHNIKNIGILLFRRYFEDTRWHKLDLRKYQRCLTTHWFDEHKHSTARNVSQSLYKVLLPTVV